MEQILIDLCDSDTEIEQKTKKKCQPNQKNKRNKKDQAKQIQQNIARKQNQSHIGDFFDQPREELSRKEAVQQIADKQAENQLRLEAEISEPEIINHFQEILKLKQTYNQHVEFEPPKNTLNPYQFFGAFPNYLQTIQKFSQKWQKENIVPSVNYFEEPASVKKVTPTPESASIQVQASSIQEKIQKKLEVRISSKSSSQFEIETEAMPDKGSVIISDPVQSQDQPQGKTDTQPQEESQSKQSLVASQVASQNIRLFHSQVAAQGADQDDEGSDDDTVSENSDNTGANNQFEEPQSLPDRISDQNKQNLVNFLDQEIENERIQKDKKAKAFAKEFDEKVIDLTDSQIEDGKTTQDSSKPQTPDVRDIVMNGDGPPKFNITAPFNINLENLRDGDDDSSIVQIIDCPQLFPRRETKPKPKSKESSQEPDDNEQDLLQRLVGKRQKIYQNAKIRVGKKYNVDSENIPKYAKLDLIKQPDPTVRQEMYNSQILKCEKSLLKFLNWCKLNHPSMAPYREDYCLQFLHTIKDTSDILNTTSIQHKYLVPSELILNWLSNIDDIEVSMKFLQMFTENADSIKQFQSQFRQMFTEFLQLKITMQPERLNPEEQQFLKIKRHLKDQMLTPNLINISEQKLEMLADLFGENEEGIKKNEFFFYDNTAI